MNTTKQERIRSKTCRPSCSQLSLQIVYYSVIYNTPILITLPISDIMLMGTLTKSVRVHQTLEIDVFHTTLKYQETLRLTISVIL